MSATTSIREGTSSVARDFNPANAFKNGDNNRIDIRMLEVSRQRLLPPKDSVSRKDTKSRSFSKPVNSLNLELIAGIACAAIAIGVIIFMSLLSCGLIPAIVLSAETAICMRLLSMFLCFALMALVLAISKC